MARRSESEDHASMHFHRSAFLTAAASFLAIPAAVTAETTAAPHHHGLNGAKLPPNRPINMKFRILDGPDFELTSQRGKVVVLNFFATWCPACREEAADLVTFAQANADDTFVVSVNYRETDDRVRAWRKKYAITYPIAMDESGGFFANLGLRYFPSTLFFRPDGTISCVYAASLDVDALGDERRLALGSQPDAEPTSTPPSVTAPAPSSNPRSR